MRCNPWRWLWGLIPLAMLSWVSLHWEQGRIEADLVQRSQKALDDAGLDWATVAFSGRDGIVSGRAIDEDEPRRALQTVRAVPGVRVVEGRTDLIEKVEAYSWSAVLRQKKIVLSGYVPSVEVRQSIVGLVKASFPQIDIDDDMRLARGSPERAAWLGGISFGIKQLASLGRGRVSIDTAGLSISGEAMNVSAYKAVRAALASELPAGLKLAQDKVTPPVVSPFTWSAKHAGSQLLLSGYVPSESVRDQLFAKAKSLFPKVAVVDRMEIGEGAPQGWDAAGLAALTQMARLNAATVEMRGTDLSVSGEAADESTARDVGAALKAALPSSFKSADNITFPKPEFPPASPFETSISIDGDIVDLTGFAPNEQMRVALAADLQSRFPEKTIRDRLQLASGAPEAWKSCVLAGAEGLTRLGGGRAELKDRTLAVTGRTEDAALVEALPAALRRAMSEACTVDAHVEFAAEPSLKWHASHEAGQVVLEGEVPDAATKSALAEAVGRYFSGVRIEDRMSISPATSTRWGGVADTALRLLATLRKGDAVLEGQELAIRGEAANQDIAAAVRSGLETDLAKGYRGRDILTVRSDAEIAAEAEARHRADEERAAAAAAASAAGQQKQDEADRCQQALGETMRQGQILFEFASAVIDRTSRPTLDRLADIAGECPDARIEIAGHTDSEGDADRNQALSEKRAQAVVNYLVNAGVSQSRLNAVGYGEDKPVASNATAADRAKNRRIEFKVTPN